MASEDDDVREDTQAQSLHRHFQKLLDQSFWQSIRADGVDEPLLLNELRQEAALRAWVRQIDTRASPPSQIPDERALQSIMHDMDWKYGADEWWQWAIWSTCACCREYKTIQCRECTQLVKFTELCEYESSNWSEGSGDKEACTNGVC